MGTRAAPSRFRACVATAAGVHALWCVCEARCQPSKLLDPVDPGVADTGPLSVSERLMPADLRVPTAFERVYRLSGEHEGRFARVSGAITAVFPRSQYVRTEYGDVPEIPTGTIFYIGGVPADRGGLPGDLPRRALNFFDNSARPLSATERLPPPAATDSPVSVAPARPTASLFTDDLYRRMVVSDLLARAVADEAPTR